MKADKDTIDFGEWKVQTKWEDIDLETFSKIEKYVADSKDGFDIREVLHILTNKTKDDINMLPAEFLDNIMGKLEFLSTKPETVNESKNEIIIDGEKYSINYFEKMKTGEYVAMDMAIKNDKYDYASVLAILCRKKGEIYDSKFEAEVFEERRKMFLKQPVVNILPCVNFFLELWLQRETRSQLYTQAEEAINHIQERIDNLPKTGVFRKLYLNLQVKRLRKLLKSSKSI